MAFLFKSKKNADKAQAAKDGVGSAASLQSQSARGAPNEKGVTTPSGSVNNSMNSLQGGGGTATPSPDQLNGRRGPSVEQAQDVSTLDAFHPLRCVTRRQRPAALNANLVDVDAEWRSAICKCESKCFFVSMVPATDDLYDSAS